MSCCVALLLFSVIVEAYVYQICIFFIQNLTSRLAQSVKILSCIREFACSNISSHTGYLDYIFPRFSSVLEGNSGISENEVNTVSFHIPSNPLFMNNSDFQRYILAEALNYESIKWVLVNGRRQLSRLHGGTTKHRYSSLYARTEKLISF
jgi:hypothetical protein